MAEPLRYDPPGPVATAFFKSNSRRRILVGPFGSGKSVVCCQEIVDRATLQKPTSEGVRKSRWPVVRNTYAELKHTTVKTWKDWFGPQFGQFIDAAPFEHRMKFGLKDGSRVDCEVVFLALDREEDAKKLLSLEATGIYFNEVREIRRSIVEAGDGRIGRYPSMRDGGPSWHGIIADTNMPDEDHWLYELAENGVPGWEFFRQPGGVVKVNGQWVSNEHAENLHNLVPGYYTEQLVGKSEEWVSVHLGAEYGRIPTEGSYYFEELALAEREQRICDINVNPELPVHMFWDMGVGDDMVIWFGQGNAGDWNWLSYYENTGKNLNHYATYLDDLKRDRRWKFGDTVWPHDGGNREMTGVAEDMAVDQAPRRQDIWRNLTGKDPIVLANSGIGDGIEGVRNLIRRSRFDRKGCEVGLRKLRRYHRKRDKVRSIFLKTPDHDENSHAADGFRTAAMGKNAVSNSSGSWDKPIKYPQMAIA